MVAQQFKNVSIADIEQVFHELAFLMVQQIHKDFAEIPS